MRRVLLLGLASAASSLASALAVVAVTARTVVELDAHAERAAREAQAQREHAARARDVVPARAAQHGVGARQDGAAPSAAPGLVFAVGGVAHEVRPRGAWVLSRGGKA